MTSVLDSAIENSIDVDGVATHYWEEGSGHPVVLIHGGGAGADALGNWTSCWKAFSGSFRTIAYDMLGYGGSIAEHEDFVYSQDARTEHLRGFLDAKGLDQVSLVGNSMGGATALGFAIRYPERVRTLTLMGSAGLSPLPESAPIAPELLTIIGYQEPDKEAMRRLVDGLTNKNYVPRDEMVEYRYRLTTNEKVMHAYKATMQWNVSSGGLHYDEGDISKVETPTLVVSGREDAVVPLEQSLMFHRLIPNSSLYSIPQCGHWAMIEHPEEFSAVTTRFIRERTEN